MFLLPRRAGNMRSGKARGLCFLCWDLGRMEHGAIWAGVFVGRKVGGREGVWFDLASGHIHSYMSFSPPLAQQRVAILCLIGAVVIPQGGFFSCDGKAVFLCFFMSHPDWAAK